MAFNSKGEFPDHDRMMLELTSKSDWIPLEPSSLVIPYMEKEGLADKTDIENRREKAQQVMKDYGKIIEECETLRAKIEEKSKNIVVPIDPSKDVRVMEAASRLFGRKVTEITFAMYKEAIERLAVISDQDSPKIGGLDGTS
jgi:hypothetical protein